MRDAFICDAIRTPIGRYGGSLAGVRADDLGAIPLRALQHRNPTVDWAAVDDVIYGCANQAGEDNRNVARMSALLAGLPVEVPGTTVNRLCGSGLDAVGLAARAIRAGEAELMLAGGVESMSRAPFVMGKAETAFSRDARIYDTTIGWRFVNPAMEAAFGTDSMPETADNVAAEFGIARADQDAFALRSQQRWAAADAAGCLRRRDRAGRAAAAGRTILVARDEHPRPEHDAGEARAPQGHQRRRAQRHRRQRLGRQRRRLRAAARLRGGRQAPRPDPARPRRRHGHGRRAAPGHGHRPGAGDAQGAGPGRPHPRRDGRDRAQRGLRRPGAGGAARSSACPTTRRR